MQFIKDDSRKLGIVTVEHRGETIVFDTSRYIQPDEYSDPANLFQALNHWWRSLPDQYQDEIFKVFQECREILDTVYETGRRQAGLRRQLKRLYELNELPVL